MLRQERCEREKSRQVYPTPTPLHHPPSNWGYGCRDGIDPWPTIPASPFSSTLGVPQSSTVMKEPTASVNLDDVMREHACRGIFLWILWMSGRNTSSADTCDRVVLNASHTWWSVAGIRKNSEHRFFVNEEYKRRESTRNALQNRLVSMCRCQMNWDNHRCGCVLWALWVHFHSYVLQYQNQSSLKSAQRILFCFYMNCWISSRDVSPAGVSVPTLLSDWLNPPCMRRSTSLQRRPTTHNVCVNG